MWPGCFCAIHSDQHEIQRVRFNDGRVMWMSLHYEAPESNPCTHSLTHSQPWAALPPTLEQPEKSQWERWWEKAQWKEWHRCSTNARKWHTGLFLHSHLEEDAEMRRTSSHSTICHLGFEWAGPADQDMLIKVHFLSF